MKRKRSISIFGIFLFLVAITAGVVLYAQGYRIDLTRGVLEKTGIILAESAPEGAKIYLDGEFSAVTTSSISNLKPGIYRLKLEKEGYFSWEEDVLVKEGFVTEISTILPPLSPSLTAVTQNGARLVSRAPSGGKAVFISGEGSTAEEAKLYLFSLASATLGFLRTTPQKIAEGNETFPLSEAIAICWSPNEDQLLISTSDQYFLISVAGKADAPVVIVGIDELLTTWEQEIAKQREDIIAEAELDEELAAEAVKPTTVWSPNERRFLYEKAVNGKRQFWVADISDPLLVGQEAHQLILETENEQSKIFWLADSYHFVMIESGTVSLLDLDGSNKRNLFKGTLAEDIALSTTDLSKIIVLTAIAPESPSNLYAISLR